MIEEIAALKDRHQLLLCTGGGTRARHAYDLALDLELPTGVLAALGGFVPRQNARILQMLLAKHGGIFILHDDFEKLPMYFRMGCIPIMSGMPPFGYWEKPSATGQIQSPGYQEKCRCQAAASRPTTLRFAGSRSPHSRQYSCRGSYAAPQRGHQLGSSGGSISRSGVREAQPCARHLRGHSTSLYVDR